MNRNETIGELADCITPGESVALGDLVLTRWTEVIPAVSRPAPNRATRRGHTLHPRRAGSRADYRPGFARPY